MLDPCRRHPQPLHMTAPGRILLAREWWDLRPYSQRWAQGGPSGVDDAHRNHCGLRRASEHGSVGRSIRCPESGLAERLGDPEAPRNHPEQEKAAIPLTNGTAPSDAYGTDSVGGNLRRINHLASSMCLGDPAQRKPRGL